MSKRIRKPLTPAQREAKRIRDRKYRAAKKAAKLAAVKKPVAKKPVKAVKAKNLKEKVVLPKKCAKKCKTCKKVVVGFSDEVQAKFLFIGTALRALGTVLLNG